MKYDDLHEFVFEFLNEFFLIEASGISFLVSDEVYEERLAVCRGCHYYDDSKNECRECGCYLNHKAKDPFASCPIDQWGVDNRQWIEQNYSAVLNSMRERTGKYD